MKLSVIVPVYNLERYVSSTMGSLLNAAFPFDYEIIVVNDGSTDNSRGIIEDYQKRTDRICLLNMENGGVSNARNVGLAHASGDYITFVDGDDTVESGFFCSAVRELDEGGYGFVQANLKIIEGERISYIQRSREDRIMSGTDAMLELFFGPRKLISNSVCGKVFRAELIRGLSFDSSIRIAEDQKFVFDAILSAQSVKLLCMDGYDYYQRSESAMHTLDRERAEDILDVLDYCRSRAESKTVRTLIDTDRVDVLFFIYHDLLLNGLNGDPVYEEIMELWPEVKKMMRKKAWFKAALLKYDRRLYDLILKRSRS